MESVELKIARIRAGLKQYELARILGITPVRLCRFELGRCPIPPELLEKIKKVLNEAQKNKAKV